MNLEAIPKYNSDVVYINKVLSPVQYKDENGEIREFKEIENTLQINFEEILQGVSLDADLTSIPTLKHFSCEKANLSILNYTPLNLSFSNTRSFFVEEKKVISFNPNDCRIIVYHTKNNPEIICFENKDDKEEFAEQRNFIIKISNVYSVREARMMGNRNLNPHLYSQPAFQINDVETFIKSNKCMSNLVKQIAREAALKKEPSLIQYRKQKERPRLTVLNHTDLLITFDIMRNLFINNQKIVNFNYDDCQIIAYHLKGHKEMICIEQQDEKDNKACPRIYAKLEYEYADASEFNVNIDKT